MLTPSESGIIREGVGVQIILKLWHLFLATRQKAHRYIDQKVPQVEVFYLISYLAISTLIIQMNVCFICRYSVSGKRIAYQRSIQKADPVLIQYASACIYRTVHFVPWDSLGCQKQQGWTNMDRVSIIQPQFLYLMVHLYTLLWEGGGGGEQLRSMSL